MKCGLCGEVISSDPCPTCGWRSGRTAEAATAPKYAVIAPVTPTSASGASPVAPTGLKAGGAQRGPLIAVGCAILALVGLALAVRASSSNELTSNHSSSVEYGAQNGSDGAPESEESEDLGSGSLLAEALGSGGVWNGNDDGDSYMYTVGLEGDSQSGFAGIVHAWQQDLRSRASWEATAQVVDGSLVVTPGDWILRSQDWTRDELVLGVGDSGSLDGQANSEDGNGYLAVQLDRIADGPPDSEEVAQDWRVALVTRDDEALAMLEEARQRDWAQRDEISGSWVPQVASGCVGLEADSAPMSASWLLAKHSRETQEYGAITVSSADFSSKRSTLCPGEYMWISLVPNKSSSAAEANAWCDRQGLDSDNCAARYVPPRGETGTKVAWR